MKEILLKIKYDLYLVLLGVLAFLSYIGIIDKFILPIYICIALIFIVKKANILYVNKAFSKVTGYKISEIIGQNESMLSYKSTPREVYYDLWYSISRNNIWHGELVNRHKNGEPYIAELTVAPMQDPMNNTTHYLGMHRDITESYETKKNLLTQKSLIESVISASSVAMVVLDQNNKVILDNQQYKSLVSDLDHKEPVLFSGLRLGMSPIPRTQGNGIKGTKCVAALDDLCRMEKPYIGGASSAKVCQAANLPVILAVLWQCTTGVLWQIHPPDLTMGITDIKSVDNPVTVIVHGNNRRRDAVIHKLVRKLIVTHTPCTAITNRFPDQLTGTGVNYENCVALGVVGGIGEIIFTNAGSMSSVPSPVVTTAYK